MNDLLAPLSRLRARTWFGLFAVLAFLRSPHVLLEGRFWAEEGSVHFAHAVNEGGFAGLTFIDQRAGYLNLIPNLGTWLASLLPLSVAPLVTGWLSFTVLLLLLWVTIVWPSELLPTKAARLVAAGLLLFGPLAHPEVWLNTINSQTYLGIAAIVLLFVRLDELGPRAFRASVVGLAVAALSGLYTVVLAPLFVVRASIERSRRSIIHAATICGATAFQGIIVLVSRTSGSLEESKLTIPGLRELVATFGSLHVSPIFLGRAETEDLANNVIAGSGAWTFTVLLTVAGVIGVVAYAVRGAAPRLLLLLAGAFVLTEGLVQLGAWGIADARYAVVPLAIVSLLLAHAVGIATEPIGRTFALGLVTVALLVGASEYWTEKRIALACIECPDWQAEIDQWEADPADGLQIWPYPPWPFTPWTIQLDGD
ncbi:MAG: hypothetical protein AAF548_01635 [Actinomycetota bacterium]